MKPRHRIKDVRVWLNDKSAGFTVITKNGTSSFPVGSEQACNYTLRKLRDQLGHLEETVFADLLGGATTESLQEALKGRYIYGHSREVENQKTGELYYIII